MIKVSKSNKVNHFKIRSSSGEGWSDFVIFFNENEARNLNISVISDYGDILPAMNGEASCFASITY